MGHNSCAVRTLILYHENVQSASVPVAGPYQDYRKHLFSRSLHNRFVDSLTDHCSAYTMLASGWSSKVPALGGSSTIQWMLKAINYSSSRW